MGECEECTGDENLPNRCKYCGGTFCVDHRLPESHDCPGLKNVGTETRHFESAFDEDGDANPSGSGKPFEVAKSQTLGSTPDPDYDSSPDINPDGSIADRSNEDSEGDERMSHLSSFVRGLRGIRVEARYRGYCLHCEEYAKPSAGAKMTTCDNCGWRPGLPLLRWVTHYPNWYRWRHRTWVVTKTVMLIAVTVAALALLSGASLPQAVPGGSDLPEIGGAGLAPNGSMADSTTTISESSTTDQPVKSTSSDDGEQLVAQDIEQYVHQYINEERQERGISTLKYDRDLAEIAEYHSQDMGKSGYFAHTAPDGETMEDRYEKFRYSCRVSTGANEYATGGENIAKTWAFVQVETDQGEVYHDSAKDVARGIVRQWMNSPGHRENILKNHWENEGIGVYLVREGGKLAVYATQNFC